MMKKPEACVAMDASEESLVLAALEPDQLAAAKKQHVPRRQLKGAELAVLWALRLYLLFMAAVVLYQAWIGTH
jgi:hypothetical protein